MKNLYKSILAVTAAVMAFTGCVKEQPLAPQNSEKTTSLTIIADAQPYNLTKTQMEGNDVIWGSREMTSFYADGVFFSRTEYGIPTPNYVVTITPDHKLQAKFTTLPANTQNLDGFFSAKYSKQAQILDSQTKVASAFGITLPSLQNVTTTTFDPVADALVMDRIDVSNIDLAQPVAYARYHRLNAITKLSFTGLENYATENVTSVEFATSNTELAGEFTYDYVAKKFVDMTGAEQSECLFNFNASKSVIMNFHGNTKPDANFASWMVTAARTLKANEVVTVTVTTDKHVITGSFTLPADKVFTNTKLNTLTLNMANAKVSAVQAVNFEPGDYVILYKDSKSYQAVSSQKSKYNVKPVAVKYDGTAAEFTTNNKDIIFTLAKDANGDYSLKNKQNGQYLIQKDPYKGHINSSYSTTAQYFDIFENNGKYGIRINGNVLNLNSYTEFSFEPAKNMAMTECLILPVKVDPIPVIKFNKTNFTAESNATTLSIPFTRNEFAKDIVKVAVTSGNDWLSIESAEIANPGTSIKCTFTANTGAERTATLKVSYTGLADQTITVKQSEEFTGLTEAIVFSDVATRESWATDAAAFKQGDVQVDFSAGCPWKPTDKHVRIYSGKTMTVSVASGKSIAKVVFNIAKDGKNITPDVGTITSDGKTWTGNAATIKFNANGQYRLNGLTVYYN